MSDLQGAALMSSRQVTLTFHISLDVSPTPDLHIVSPSGQRIHD